MEPNLYIRYKNDGPEGLSLTSLGESMAGFDKAIKELFKISKIQGQLNIIPVEIKQGSILINIVLEILSNHPFENVKDLLNFLQVADYKLFLQVSDLLSTGHRTINDFGIKNPIDMLFAWEFGKYVVKNLIAIPKLKHSLVYRDEEGRQLPTEFISPLKKSIERGMYKNALRPFVEDQVSEIEIGSCKENLPKISIYAQNIDGYLADKEKIMPDYLNGDTIKLSGEIVGLQSNYCDSMTFRSCINEKWFSLVMYPPENKSTIDYIEFYKEQALISAEILRKSLYQKPKLVLKTIQKTQPTLGLEKNNRDTGMLELKNAKIKESDQV